MIQYKWRDRAFAQIGVFTFNPFQENTYVLYDETNECVIIDPGCYSTNEEELLDEFITSNQLSPVRLINTHCHIDHIFGNAFIKRNYDCQFLAPEEDVFLLQNSVDQAKMFGIEIDPSPLPDDYITESTGISLGGCSPQFLFTH